MSERMSELRVPVRSSRRKLRTGLLLAGLAVVVAAIATSWYILHRETEPEDLHLYARGVIVLDLDHGATLYELNADEKLAPASLTKLMAMLLVFEEIESGRLSYDQTVRVSERAVGTFASKAGLKAGENMTVDTLLKCVFLPSGSDAVLALAEHLYGSEEKFVEAMNRKALQLGLKNTRFQNSTGLDQGGQYSTPRDLAVISRELVTKYPEVYAYSSLKSAVVQHEDGSHLYLKNTNDMLGFEGINGLKTGSSANGGYHLAMTYQKDGKHLLFVIMGEDLPYFRKEDSKKLLDQFT